MKISDNLIVLLFGECEGYSKTFQPNDYFFSEIRFIN